MKKLLLIFISSAIFAGLSGWLHSCKEVDEWTKYALAYDSEVELIKEVFTAQDSVYEVSCEYLINFDNELEKRAVKEKQIERITLQMLELSFKSSSEQRDFSFIESFTFTLTGPNFPERVIAEGETIKAGLSVARFNVNQADGMVDLMKGNEFVIKFKFKLKQPLQKDAQFLIIPRFEMDARQFFI